MKSQGSTLELPLILLVLSSREVSGIPSVEVKSCSSTVELPLILKDLSYCEVVRMCGVAVKCVDIKKNTGSEGGSLECY